MVIGSAEYVAALRAEMAAQISASSARLSAITTEIASTEALMTAKASSILQDRELLVQKQLAIELAWKEGNANLVSAAKDRSNTYKKGKD